MDGIQYRLWPKNKNAGIRVYFSKERIFNSWKQKVQDILIVRRNSYNLEVKVFRFVQKEQIYSRTKNSFSRNKSENNIKNNTYCNGS